MLINETINNNCGNKPKDIKDGAATFVKKCMETEQINKELLLLLCFSRQYQIIFRMIYSHIIETSQLFRDLNNEDFIVILEQ